MNSDWSAGLRDLVVFFFIFDACWHDFSSTVSNFMEMCSPPSVGSTFPNNDVLQISCARRCFHTETGFKTTTFGGGFPPCAVQKLIYFADWAENRPLWKPYLSLLLLSHSFSSRFSYFRSWFCHCIPRGNCRSTAPFTHETNTSWWLLLAIADRQ